MLTKYTVSRISETRLVREACPFSKSYIGAFGGETEGLRKLLDAFKDAEQFAQIMA